MGQNTSKNLGYPKKTHVIYGSPLSENIENIQKKKFREIHSSDFKSLFLAVAPLCNITIYIPETLILCRNCSRRRGFVVG